MLRCFLNQALKLNCWSLFTVTLVSLCSTEGLAAEAYRFTYRGLENGDTTLQEVDLDLNLTVTVEQAGQTIDKTKHVVLRKQRCRMTVLESVSVEGALVKTKVKLIYESADQSQSQNDEPAEEAPLPVAGKTYFASLIDNKLVITDERGNRPSDEEWAIVATATETLGKSNPIAKFFDGKTYSVGQELRMPPQLAKDLLGFSGRLDNASKLILTFTKVQMVGGKPCAVFDTLLESTMTQGTTMKMQMQGKLMLEIETCRAASIELAGPVKLAEAHGPADGQFTINTQGNMKMALRAGYTQVR
jgi:hypothetical protein